MKFKTLTIKNFMSYKTASIDLSNRGLVLIEGKKNGITTFSNGSGKTNLLEAVPWVLWGQLSSKKVASNDVVYDYKDNCEVSIEIDDFKIVRYRKHKEFKNDLYLYIKDKDVRGASEGETQQKIDKLLGSTLDSFTQSVFLNQTLIKSFASATETERKVILEKLLGNEHYQDILKDIVQPQIKDLKEELSEIEEDLEIVQDDKTKIQGRIDFLKEKQRLFDREKFLKIESIKAKLNISNIEAPDVASSVDIETGISQLEEEIKIYEKKLEGLPKVEGEILELVRSLSKLESEQEMVDREISKLERQLSAPVTSLAGRNCPTCGKLVDKHDVDLYKSKIEEQIEKLKNKRPTGAKPLKADLNVKKEEKKRLLEFQSGISLRRKNISSLKQELIEISKREEKEKAEHLQLKRELQNAQQLVSPYPELITKEEGDLKTSTLKEVKILNDIETIKKRIPYLEVMENIFSRTGKQELPSIPSLKLDGILPQLTSGVNRRLREISDDLSVEFDTISTTQRGKVTDKFNVRVLNSNGADVYGGNSGGEKKLVDIAIMLALGDIAAQRNTNSIPILLLDELFGLLDASAKESVMSLLRDEAKYKESIFVTTLDPELSSMFENKLVVNKVGKTSHLIDYR